MDLDVRQTRRMCLAGTAAFPRPFPSTSGISIEDGSLAIPTDTQKVMFVVVQEKSGRKRAALRVVLKEDVAAIFFPGVWKDGVFHFAEGYCVHDLEKGEWFLKPEIDVKKISAKLKIDIRSRDSGARGIVFVPESKPVLSIHESTRTAGDAAYAEDMRDGCITRDGCFAAEEE